MGVAIHLRTCPYSGWACLHQMGVSRMGGVSTPGGMSIEEWACPHLAGRLTVALVPVSAQREAGAAAAAEGAEGVEAVLGAAGAHGALVHICGGEGGGFERGFGGPHLPPTLQGLMRVGESLPHTHLGVSRGGPGGLGGALTEAGAAVGAEAEPGVAATGEGSRGVGAAVLAPAELALILICARNSQNHPINTPKLHGLLWPHSNSSQCSVSSQHCWAVGGHPSHRAVGSADPQLCSGLLFAGPR